MRWNSVTESIGSYAPRCIGRRIKSVSGCYDNDAKQWVNVGFEYGTTDKPIFVGLTEVGGESCAVALTEDLEDLLFYRSVELD